MVSNFSSSKNAILLFPCHCNRLKAKTEDFVIEHVNLMMEQNIYMGILERKTLPKMPWRDTLSFLYRLSEPSYNGTHGNLRSGPHFM